MLNFRSAEEDTNSQLTLFAFLKHVSGPIVHDLQPRCDLNKRILNWIKLQFHLPRYRHLRFKHRIAGYFMYLTSS